MSAFSQYFYMSILSIDKGFQKAEMFCLLCVNISNVTT